MSRDLKRAQAHLRAIASSPRIGESKLDVAAEKLATAIVETARRFDHARSDNTRLDCRRELLALAEHASSGLAASFEALSRGHRQNLIRAVEYALAILKREP